MERDGHPNDGEPGIHFYEHRTEGLDGGGRMTRQRQILVTVTYNDLGCIIDTKAEPYEEPNLQQTCNNFATDTISRQAAINYVDDIPYIKEHPNLGLIWKEWIEALPSAEPEPQWIPVSERLPENDKRVLATTAWGDVTIAERIYPPINDTCWFIQDGNTNATIDDVVAWMPLPEPYKE